MPTKTPRRCRICKRQRILNSLRSRVCYECLPRVQEKKQQQAREESERAEAYLKLVDEHGEFCMICGAWPMKRRLNVDCHKSGVIRGLLCYRCNYGLHWFRDNPAFLRAAAAYLERFPTPATVTDLLEFDEANESFEDYRERMIKIQQAELARLRK